MKPTTAFLLLSATCVIGHAATVSDVTARQRWPWNGLVDIDYTITGDDTENMVIAVKVTDSDTGRIYTPTNFLEVPPTGAGRHRITWSTEADKLELLSTNAVISVSLYDTTVVTNDLYYVIDLSGGVSADRFPVTCLSSVPEGGWTDEYKTKKLVLRRIEPGNISGLKTLGTGELSSIKISKPYYIGVFEVTSAQFMLITGGIGVKSDAITNDARPQGGVSYDRLCGTGDWTPDSAWSSFETSSVMEILRVKTGFESIDLPTEVQWEYACRAGTTSYFNNGDNDLTEANTGLKYLGRYYSNGGGYSGSVCKVGSYLPNAWGLYDMHGNVAEWCLDWYTEDDSRVLRGGSYLYYARFCRSGTRASDSPSNQYSQDGFRLCCAAEL